MHHTLTMYCDKMGVAAIYHVNLFIISKPKHGYSSVEILTIGITHLRGRVLGVSHSGFL